MDKLTGWVLEIGDTGYLDGIVATATVREAADKPENEWCARDVAYCFDEGQARLIAAAPELLAALKLAENALLFLREEYRLDITNALPTIRAAIAKAEDTPPSAQPTPDS